MMHHIVMACLCLALGFCEHATEPATQKIGVEFELKYKESAQIEQGEKFTITYKDLLEDSRCPIGVECVWAGNAKVLLRIAERDSSVNTTLEPKQTTHLGGDGTRYTVQLLAVTPYPVYGVTMKKEETKIRLIVTTDNQDR